MKVVIAPDKFKGSLNVVEVAASIAAGVSHAIPGATVDQCPLADGGEGFVLALTTAMKGSFVTRRVTGPLPEMRIDATFGIVEAAGEIRRKTAVIEMASASGLALLPPHLRDPLATTTFGTGELIRHAAELNCTRILLGIGGSATTDAGIGCAQAAGCHVILQSGQYASITEPLCGRDLPDVLMIKSHRGSPVDGVEIIVAGDVTNPLLGPTGCAAIYGPQKGASPETVLWLDAELRALATRLGLLDLADTPGSGAAGGLGFGMLAFFSASLESGIDLVLNTTRLRERLTNADLCFTAEGRIDHQSAFGKTTSGVARLCAELGVPCVVIAGSIERGLDMNQFDFSAVLSICDGPMTLDEATRDAAPLLRHAASNATRLFDARLSTKITSEKAPKSPT